MQINDNFIGIKKKIDSNFFKNFVVYFKRKSNQSYKSIQINGILILNMKYSGNKKELLKQNCEKIKYL